MSPEREHSESLRIEAYLAGEMNPEQQTAFEAECEADPALQELLEQYLLTRIIVPRSGEQNQKEQWTELRAEMQASEAQTRPLRKLRPYLVAAVVFLMLIWGGLLLFVTTPASSEKLFADFYERPQAPERMGNSVVEAERYYREGDFMQSIASYEALAADSSQTLATNAYLYWGIAYLEIGEADSALARFAELENLAEIRQWYEALVYLKKEEITHAKALLEAIKADEGHFYQAKAEDLLQQMN